MEDVTYEGWIALALCILKRVPHDEAYELLDNPKKKRTWTDDVIEVCVNDINHAFYELAETCKEVLKQLIPFIVEVAKLMQEINEANKPTQGREVFREFVEGKNKSKNRFDRRYKR